MHGYFLLEHDSLVMLLLLCQMSSLLALHMIMPFLNGLPWTFLSFFIISSISFFSLYGHSVSFTVSAVELPGDDSYPKKNTVKKSSFLILFWRWLFVYILETLPNVEIQNFIYASIFALGWILHSTYIGNTQGSVTNVITTKLHHSVLYKFGNSAYKLIGYLSEYLMV